MTIDEAFSLTHGSYFALVHRQYATVLVDIERDDTCVFNAITHMNFHVVKHVIKNFVMSLRDNDRVEFTSLVQLSELCWLTTPENDRWLTYSGEYIAEMLFDWDACAWRYSVFLSGKKGNAKIGYGESAIKCAAKVAEYIFEQLKAGTEQAETN